MARYPNETIKILELLERSEMPLTLSTINALTEPNRPITHTNATVQMLLKEGKVDRIGKRCRYRYYLTEKGRRLVTIYRLSRIVFGLLEGEE